LEYRKLGRTGLKVSRLCLGTMNFGPHTSPQDSFAIMDRALEAGINFFDTANVYGGGRTEEIIGEWFAKGGGRREKVVLATKVYNGPGDWPNTSRLSARHIRDACEASLRRLRTDFIDLYQMHHVDRDTPWEEVWQAMDLLVSQGKVIYVGSSNFAAWHIVQANEAARRAGLLGLVSEQSLYNLMSRTVELEVVPACASLGVGLIPWSPLGGGLLGGKLGEGESGRRSSEEMRAGAEWMAEKLGKYEALCSELGQAPANVALAWLLANPVVTAPIIGPRTLAQLEGALGSLEVDLDQDAMKRLDRIFPGPGGPAPEAYAW
jgi:aryl-alcohol dehydrogenase-like predicted oxidoreductase